MKRRGVTVRQKNFSEDTNGITKTSLQKRKRRSGKKPFIPLIL